MLLGPLAFLKLGGSLITDKSRPHTPRPETLARLAGEIAAARAGHPDMQLLLGHGSGSFGHVPAMEYGTRQGVRTKQQWRGFIEVWREAAALDRLVMDALLAAGLPAIACPPSASLVAHDGQIVAWDVTPLQSALAAGLLPVVYGDAVFDTSLGGAILSTEELFDHLARRLRPARILLAGIEPGVYPPQSPHFAAQKWGDERGAGGGIIPEITPASFPAIAASLGGSANADVTGGMASKVQLMLALVEELPGLEVCIFSGETPGNVQAALGGKRVGTRLCSMEV